MMDGTAELDFAVPFCHSLESYNAKPANASVLQRKPAYVQESLSIQDIAKLCGTGHAWRAGIYDSLQDGTFRKSDVRMAQVIALDFDASHKPPCEAVAYAEDIGLPVTYWYPSYSQNPEMLSTENMPKSAVLAPRLISIYISHGGETSHFAYKNGYNYRLCWALERAISPREYEDIYKSLQVTFADFAPDKTTKDCSRLWYGGRLGAEVLNNKPLPMTAIGAMTARAKVQAGQEPRKVMRQSKGYIQDYAEMPEPECVVVGDGWHQRLRGKCRLWDKWQAGEYLDYNERLALLSNLKYLRYSSGSKSIIKDVLAYYDVETYKEHSCDEAQIRRMMADRSLKPFAIVHGPLGAPMTVPDYLASPESHCITPQLPKVSIDELDAWMDRHVPSFLADATPGIQVLKSQTGSGKTHRIIDYILNQADIGSNKIIYCAPKHSNLAEVEQRLLAKATFAQSSRIHRCPAREVNQADLIYLSLGLPAKTRSAERKGFLDKLYDKSEPGVYLMTHSLLTALSNVQADLIIIDEEIDSSLIKETHIDLPSLGTLVPFLSETRGERLTRWIYKVRDMTREDGLDIDLGLLQREIAPAIEAQIDDYIARTTSNLAVGLFDCLRVGKGRLGQDAGGHNYVRLVRKSPLIDNAVRDGVPIRVLTATPLNKRTELYYSMQIKVITAPMASNNGKLIQYAGKTGARGLHNANLSSLSAYIKECLPPEVIARAKLITFKASRDEQAFWQSEGFALAEMDGTQIHLLNNSGLDCLKGQELIVAGKLDLPQEHYQNMYDDIHQDAPRLLTRQNQTVELNGVRQTLYLFDDDYIRDIQLQYIQSITEQAVGRARALREGGATVYLFCNLVIGDIDEVRQ